MDGTGDTTEARGVAAAARRRTRQRLDTSRAGVPLLAFSRCLVAERVMSADARRVVDEHVLVVVDEGVHLAVERPRGRPMTGKSGSLLRAAAQSSALPCGPASMRRTRAPVLARLEPMLIASVVLPTPPLLVQ